MWKTLWNRIGKRRRWEAAMDEEMRSHIAERAAHLMKQGLSEEAAKRQARVEFGGIEVHKELCRETSWLARTLDELRRNLHYALRSLRKSPGFTAIGVLSLGLGIGANLATFSLIERLMLNELPVRDPQGLYSIGTVREQGFQSSQSYIHFTEARANCSDIFSETLAWSTPRLMEAKANDRLEQVSTSAVSGSYFPMLGIQAHIGRLFTSEDDRPGSPNIAVLGYDFWRRLFDADPGVLEQSIQLGGVSFQIVGVAPAGFHGTELSDPPGVFITLHGNVNFAKGSVTAEGMMWLHGMVRLKPGVSLEVAKSILGPRSIELGMPRRIQFGRLDKPRPTTLEPAANGYSEVRNEFTKPLLVLMALVSVVLLIACANLSTLLFVRGAGRSGEMSLRLALGASRGGLIRQCMTECMLVAAAGGILAILLARWIVDLLLLFVGQGAHQYLSFHGNGRMLLFSLLLTLGAGLLFGLLPSLRSAQANPGVTLKTAQPSILGRKNRNWRWVMVLQIAASLVLVTGAALFARTLWNLSQTSGGFARSEVVWASVKFNRQKPVKGEQIEEAVARLRNSPFIASISKGRIPLSGGGWNWATVPGYVPRANEDNIVYFSDVSPGYFRTMNIEMLSGRDFEEADGVWPPKAIIVSQSFAHHYFGDKSPLGAKVKVFRFQPESEIVGVVRDTKYSAFRETKRDVVYNAIQKGGYASIVARAKNASELSAVMTEIRSAVKAVAPHAELDTGTLEDSIRRSIRRDRLVGQLSAAFGFLGLIIASIGLYGAMAHEVASRTREIGIRIALGANPWNVMRATLAEVGVVLGLGILIGIPACLAGTRLIESLLFEVSAYDPLAFGAAAMVLALAALVAAAVPARRATRLDPSQALRYE